MARRKNSTTPPTDQGKETKEQKKARLIANKLAQETAINVILPSLGLCFFSFVVLLFYFFGLGHSGVIDEVNA